MLKNWLKLVKKNFKRTAFKLGSFFLYYEDPGVIRKKIKRIKKSKDNIKDNFIDFIKEEKREIRELVSGKQTFRKYCRDASDLFKDYFIPSADNDNRPKILRPKQLTIIAILLIILKVSLVGYLFSIYQETAEMSETTVNQLLLLTNESRVASGASPVKLNPVLNQAAQAKADDMLAKNYFSHTSPDGRKPWHFVNRNAYPYLLVGENLGMNFIAASDVHAALMASPSHKKNLLNPKYTDVGLAVVNGELNGENTNILVEIFAYKKEPTETIAIVPTASGADTFKAVVVDSEVVTVENKPEAIAEIIPLITAETTTPSSVTETVASKPSPEASKPSPENTTPSQEPVSRPKEEIIVAAETETQVDVLAQAQEVVMPIISTVDLPTQVANNQPENLLDNTETSNINTETTSATNTETVNTETADNVDNLSANQVATEATTDATPEEIMSNQELPTEQVVIATSSNQDISKAGKIIKLSKVLYIFFLVFLIISLAINIFVHIKVQHKSIILQAILLIILLLALLLFDFDFMTELKNAANNIVLN